MSCSLTDPTLPLLCFGKKQVVQGDVFEDAAEGTETMPWIESAGERRRARSLGETGKDFIPHSMSSPKRPRTDKGLVPQGEGIHPAAFSLMRVRCVWSASGAVDGVHHYRQQVIELGLS